MTEELNKSGMAIRLEQRMEEVGFPTKGRLSTVSGVSRAILTNIMRRPDKEIWASVAVRLAKSLSCRVEWLVEGTGPVTDDVEKDHQMVYGHCPVITIDDLAVDDLKSLVIERFEDEQGKVLHSPILSGKYTVAVKAERKLGKFDEEDYVFIDLDKTNPRSGQLVLARKKGTNGTPDFYTYNSALDEAYLRSLIEDLPQELKLIKVTNDIEVIGCVIASTKIF